MEEIKRKYDFAGWVTKNDIRCKDGVTIKHDAFRENDGERVPLVWNHQDHTVANVLGHMLLHNRPTGVYGYGYFNETENATHAKEMIKHGDITSMSIGANEIKRQKSDVVHGRIYEVSLVLAGANPGATIETIMQHSATSDETAIICTGTLIHSQDDILEEPDLKHADGEKEQKMENTQTEKTVGDVIKSMTDEQKDAVYGLIGSIVEQYEDEEEEDNEGDETVKQNVFNMTEGNDEQNDVLRHSMVDALNEARNMGASSLKQVMKAKMGDTLKHGVNSIEMLFPEAPHSTNGNEPIIYKDPNTAYMKIINGIHKSPFSRIRTLVADLTEEEARAKGYIKGTMKKEQFFSLIKRTTEPTTVYKKQKIDRDDVVDITDFNIVNFMSKEMRMMLLEELARAALVSDGRAIDNPDKIKEDKIRPIISDNEFFTIHATYPNAAGFTEAVILAMADYRGSGVPDMYIDPTLLAQVKLLKGTDGRFLFGAIPSTSAIAAMLGVGEIIPTTFMVGKGALIVNLGDYSFGSTKGGEVTNFDDFDIDFNQHKYLIETRLCGALTLPKSAIHMNPTAPLTGATDLVASLVYGERQADKPPVEPEV